MKVNFLKEKFSGMGKSYYLCRKDYYYLAPELPQQGETL